MWGIALGSVIFVLSASLQASCRQPFATELIVETFATPLLALRGIADRVEDARGGADVEHAGALVLDSDGRVRASIGRGCPRRDRVAFEVRIARDQAMLAFWHTHGRDGHLRRLFSEADAAVVRRYGLPFYLLVPDGGLRVLTPGNVDRTRLRRGNGSAVPFRGYKGERVTAFLGERNPAFLAERNPACATERSQPFLAERSQSFLAERSQSFLAERSQSFLAERSQSFLAERSQSFLRRQARPAGIRASAESRRIGEDAGYRRGHGGCARSPE